MIVSAVEKRLQAVVFRSYAENSAHGVSLPVWFLMSWLVRSVRIAEEKKKCKKKFAGGE